jgi:hypothetical protein
VAPSACWVQVRALWRPAGGTAELWSNWTPRGISSRASITTAPNLVNGQANASSNW